MSLGTYSGDIFSVRAHARVPIVLTADKLKRKKACTKFQFYIFGNDNSEVNEVAAARAFTTLQEIISATVEGGEEAPAKVRSTLSGVLPEPTSSMQQLWRISLLLGARGGGSDLSKYIPLARKLSQEPKIQKAVNEVIARLGERVLGRSLRALFGLSPTDVK